jgi:hypothetical protein
LSFQILINRSNHFTIIKVIAILDIAACSVVEVDTCVSKVRTAFIILIIALMMGAVRTSETPVCSNEATRRYIPEGSHVHTRRRENMKSHILQSCLTLYGVFLIILSSFLRRNSEDDQRSLERNSVERSESRHYFYQFR